MSIIISPDKTISVEGENYNFHSGNLVYDYTNLSFTNLENNVFKFENGLVLTTNCEKSQHTAVIRHNNVIKNTSSNPITLNKAASLAVCGIAENGEWYQKGRIKIHYVKCSWQGEFQWKTTDLQKESIFPVSSHQNSAEFVISSSGSWSTAKYYPLLLIEDTFQNTTYFFEVESSTSWNIVIYNSKTEGEIGSIAVTAGGANILVDGWNLTLMPSETYQTASVLYGEVNGGKEAALNELIKYKRLAAKTKLNTPPIIYNCYMNGIWSNPTDEKLIPLIDAAADVGAEIFCIDAGWHSPVTSEITLGIGDWNEDKSRFRDKSLAEILGYIKAKGMVPGVWFELESCQANCEIAKKLGQKAFLCRNGMPIGKSRLLFDFSNPKVKEHLFASVKCLYEMGVRFIKNDYNQSSGIGVEKNNLSLSQALKENSKNFLNFIDDLKAAFPDLIIENCGSGAMRADGETLSHFHIQSISDQENYCYLPSIISGGGTIIPPEKLGIWAMPYPVPYKDRMEKISLDYFKTIPKDEILRKTAFNMASAFMGSICLSGRIDLSDEENINFIKNTIFAYRSIRSLIPFSEIHTIDGNFSIGEKGVFAMMLNCKSERSAIVTVWNLTDSSAEKKVDLSPLGINISETVPLVILPDETTFETKVNALFVAFKNATSAATFLLKY